MKKLLFPIASFIVGLICAVAITSHSSSARDPEQPDDRPTTARFEVIQYAPVRTSIDAAQDFTTPIEHSMNEVVFQRHQEDSMTLAMNETDQ